MKNSFSTELVPQRDAASPPHQTIPEVHLPAAIRLGRRDGGGEVVDEATAVLRVFGGDDDGAAFQGDEVLKHGLAKLAGDPGQNERSAPLANCEHMKW